MSSTPKPADKRPSFFSKIRGKKDDKPPSSGTINIPAESDPQKAQLAQKFEAFMEEKCFKPDVREKMRALPDQAKWTLLMQNSQAGGVAKEKKESDDPQYWHKALQNPKLTEQELHSLEVILRGEGKSWMQQFKETGALEALLAVVSNEAKHHPASLNVLKAFMNNAYGLNVILTTSAAIEQIASVLSFGNEQMSIMAFDLLTVICWLSQKAHQSVMEALADSRFKSPRFKFLVDMLNHSPNPEVRNGCLSLLNVLINTTDQLEDRMYLRQQLYDLGLRDVIDKIQQLMFTERDPRYKEVFAKMTAQCELFEEEARNDKRETTYNGLDTADMDEVYKYVKEIAGMDGHGDHLLRLLQQLMVIPSREQGDKMWRNIDEAVAVATGQMGEEGEVPVLTYATIKEALARRAEEEGVTSTSGGSLLDAQRKQIQELKQKVQAAEEQLKATIAELKKAQAGGGGGGGGAVVATGDAAEEINRLREENEKLRAELQNAGSGGGGGDAPPAPPLDGGDVPVAPPLGDVPDAPPLDGVPMAPPLGDVPMAPPLDGVPMAPALDGVPGAPPMAPDFAPPIDEGPKLPPKRTIKPSVPMKNIHWSVVDPKQVEETCWKDLSDEHIKLDKLNVKELEAQFTSKRKEEKSESKAAKGALVKKKEPAVELIDSKRAYNVNIALARFRMTNEEIRDALLSMDENVLNEEKVASLLKCAPTPEEVETVRSFDGDINTLGNTEKFFRVISVVPKVEKRLNLFLFKQRFPTLVSEIENNLSLCEAANRNLRRSAHLHRVLEIVLALGNYLNGGTKKGGAYGFKLDTLFKLSGTRGTDGTSLLHYLTKVVREKFPEDRAFVGDLAVLPEASRVESQFLAGEVGKLLGQIRQIGSEIKSSEGAPGDKFSAVMSTFYNNVANKKGEEIEKRLKVVQSEGEKLIKFYGENPERRKLEELYSLFRDFVEEYKHAEEFLEKKRQKEEREAKREEAKKKAAADRSPSAPEPEAVSHDAPDHSSSVDLKAEGGQVDAVMKTLQATDATDIMKQIRMRRKAAQAGRGPPRAPPRALAPKLEAAAPPRSPPGMARPLSGAPQVEAAPAVAFGPGMLRRGASNSVVRGPGGPPKHPPPPELQQQQRPPPPAAPSKPLIPNRPRPRLG